jgi:hypothetical protein
LNEVTYLFPSAEKVTIPYPSLVGKYENAIPPENTSLTGVAYRAATSFHIRGGLVIHLDRIISRCPHRARIGDNRNQI